MSFDYQPGNSLFHRLDPRTKFIMFAFVVGIAITVWDPILLALLGVFVYLWSVFSGIRDRATKVVLKFLPIFAFGYILNIAFAQVPEPPMFYLIPAWQWFPISYGRLIFAAGVLGRIVSIFLGIWTILVVTPITSLILAFVKTKMPPEIALGIGIGMASVPAFIREAKTIQEAQKARAHKTDFKNPIKKFIALVPIMIPLIWATLRRSQSIAVAIEARAFGYNLARRTYRTELRMKPADWLFIASFASLFAAVQLVGYYYPFFISYNLTYSLLKSLFHI
jgi:energy-coupling factor transport system permease protein